MSCERGDVMSEQGLDVLAYRETKWKGKKEVMLRRIKGRMSGVNEKARVKEGLVDLGSCTNLVVRSCPCSFL